MKFRIHGKLTVYVSTVVEAESADEALDKGQDITATVYVGNGSMRGLVGLNEKAPTANFNADDCYPEWDEAEVEP